MAKRCAGPVRGQRCSVCGERCGAESLGDPSVFMGLLRDEDVVAPRANSSTQKRTTSARSSALWVTTPAAQVSGETFPSLEDKKKKTCAVRTLNEVPTCSHHSEMPADFPSQSKERAHSKTRATHR